MIELVKVLPLAFLMILGPQIITAIFLATSVNAKKNSTAFLVGVMLATGLGLSVSFAASSRLGGLVGDIEGHKSIELYWIIIALLGLLGVRIFMRRNRTTSGPKWMSRIQTAKVSNSILLGFVLFLVFPTDLISWVAVGAAFANQGSPYWYTFVFTAIVVLLAAIPLILLLILGKRAQVLLPKARGWMCENSWIVSEILVIFFILIAVSDVIGA